ncbi:MAG: CopG family transcriptional regulator [Desulfurococcales archaeon]|nr:CopG family transcriptional regulator [Desulfurococcales archaeon]
MGDYVEVKLRKEVYDKARKFIEEQGGFKSVDELIEFLLEEALAADIPASVSREDEEKIKDRLRSLGYI